MTFNDAIFNEFVNCESAYSIIFNFFFYKKSLKIYFFILFNLIYSNNVMEKITMYV